MATRTSVVEWLNIVSRYLVAGRKSSQSFRRRHLVVESLEARALLTTFSVTNLNDAGPGSLRDAISQANGNPGDDEVTFASSGTIALTSDKLSITDSLTITGNGAASTIVDGQQQGFGIFTITSGDVTMNGLTLRNGKGLIRGGAISNTSTGLLTINHCTLSGNSASCSDHNISAGGAIYKTTGTVSINQSILTGNSASGSLSSNEGGAIWASGVVAINQSMLLDNSTSTTSDFSSNRGGAIRALGSVTISQSTLSGNSARGSLSINEGGAIAAGSGGVTISQCTLEGNAANGSHSAGGAIYAGSEVTISQSILTGNSASSSAAFTGGRGGAIVASGVTISQSTLSGNSASGDGISQGGAIYAASGAVTIRQSTLAGNSAISSSKFGGSLGGAIQAAVGSVIIGQSTLSGNSAGGIGPNKGGAIHVAFGSVTISQSTLAGNSADSTNSQGGAIYAANTQAKTIRNSIVAGNVGNTGADILMGGTFTVTNCLIGRSDGTGFTATVGTTPDADGNFIGGTTDATKLDPKLSPLANNGGPTQTMALLPGSLAVDSGNSANAVDVTNGNAVLTTDQRGNPYLRISNTTVDMGSYEVFVISGPIVVDTAVDENDGDLSSGRLSLREAIGLANLSPGTNTITFATALNGQSINMASPVSMQISETLTITGNGATQTVVDAQQISRIFDIVSTAGNVTFNDMTLKNGRTTGNGTDFWDTAFAGGAIRWNSPGILTLNRTNFTGNSTLGERAAGGAILVSQGTLVVSESWFSGNSTAGVNSEGGAISAHLGGLKVRNSTFSGNSTTGDFSEGGAIFSLAGEVTISQSTISGNTASGIDSAAGGLFTQEGNILIAQSTITGNSAPISAGGGIFTLSSPIRILNSIVASNADAGAGPDIWKSQNADDAFLITNSLIGRSNGTGLSETSGSPDASGNLIGGATPQAALNPQLGPLQNNGGRTLTHAILPGSPAIDRGSNAAAIDVTNNNAALTTDQRGVGFARMLDGDQLGTAIVDMGAVEFPGLRVSSPSPNAFSLRPTFQWTPIAGATSYTVQINNESTGVAQFHMGTSTTATYTPPANLAIGRFRMWVRPNFASGVGNWSVPQAFNNLTPPTWATMARTQLTARPTLTWNALPGAVKYDLWSDNFSTGQKQVIRRDVTGTSFTPTTDLPMGTYRFWMRGVDAKGNFAGWSALQEFLVVPGPTPIGPLSATFDRTPTFSWNAVSGAVSYELYVRNTNTGAMVINGTSVTGTSFTQATNLTDGPYRWWTIAVSSASIVGGAIKSGGSNPVDLYVGGRPTMTSPTAGSSTSDRTPTFTWKAVDGAARYELLVNRINVPLVGILNPTALTTTSFTPTTDLPAGTYRAWVRAVSSTSVASAYSVQVDFTVTETAPQADGPELDYLLAGLLLSELSLTDHLVDGNSSADKSLRDLVLAQPQENTANMPVAEEHEIPHVDLDRWMMSFDLIEHNLGNRPRVRTPNRSHTIEQIKQRLALGSDSGPSAATMPQTANTEG